MSSTNLAARPERTVSDYLQEAWDHPHPLGMISILKGVMNAVNQAVQGSIDATSSPSTEEEAFRQNWGREQGPVGAFQAASVMTPMTPGGSGGIFAVPLAGALRRGLPWLPAGSRIAGQGANGPIIAGLEELSRCGELAAKR